MPDDYHLDDEAFWLNEEDGQYDPYAIPPRRHYTAITLTITAAVPASIQLLSLIRSDDGLAPSLPSPFTIPGPFTQSVKDVATWRFGPWKDPAPGIVYNYTYQITWPGGAQTPVLNGSIPGGDDLLRYMELGEALRRSRPMFGLPHWKRASLVDKYAALAQATHDVEHGLRFQGRKYIVDQVLEFPRVPWESSNPNQYPNTGPVAWLRGDRIWDWSMELNQAIVPVRVKEAVLVQANSVLQGSRAKRAEQISQGLKGQRAGALSEEYAMESGAGDGPVGNVLCRAAFQLLRDYRLRSGRLL